MLTKPDVEDAVTLATVLRELEPPVAVHLVFPSYLASSEQLAYANADRLPLTWFSDEATVPAVVLSRDLPRGLRERIERGVEGECRGLRLLSLAEHVQADGILTAIPGLLEARYELLSHHKLRIVRPQDLADFVEVCGRGHGVACSVRHTQMSLSPDVLYIFSHWKARRLCEWFNRVRPSLADATLEECIRSALLNRYSFIIHARDMVRFYELQGDYHFRRGVKPAAFRALLNYHLTSFYFHVWGMLDALAGISNLRLALGVDPRRCGISSDEFLDSLSEKQPRLHRFIKRYGNRWVTVIGDVRHPAAHSALRLQRDIVTDTPESRKSDEEIAAILRAETPGFYERFPDWEASAIWLWRVNHMKVVSDDAIYVEQPSGSYFRSPVTSIDFDLERLNAFIDAFLCVCFSRA